MSEELGPPPGYDGKTNMEYAAPGTNAWARQAWAEIARLREALEKIAATDGDEWYARSVARAALDYAREEVA